MENEKWEELIREAVRNVERSERETPVLKEIEPDRAWGKYCDHTVLRAYTPRHVVKEFCYEAIEYGAYSVAVNPCHIGLVSDILKGSDVCTGAAIGFPLGATTSATKVFEAEEAIKNGADEIDMILNIGALRDRNFEYVYQDIAGIIKISGELICKVIIETCYLTREEKIAACVVAKSAGADFVKTSTGMGSGGATVEDIILMRRAMGDKLRVKASGDIRSLADVKKMVAAGADRVGVSRLIQIVTDDDYADSASVRNQPPNC